MRPAVVWFGEDLPTQVWKTAIARVKSCDVLVSVGTSGIVMPAAGIPELALSSGATVIHVNIAEVSLGERKEIMILGKAADSLPLLIGAIAPL
jgi:NAD-dependent deacetylase